MYTLEDNGIGVVRSYWSSVSDRVRKADPEFSKLVDKLSPGNNYPIYLLYLPFGMLKGDTESSYLPMMDGRYCKLSDSTLPQEIKNELGYGMYTSPLGMILENELEYFIEFDDEIIPYDIAGPGRIFNKSILLNKKTGRNYSPNGLLIATAGSRTSFLLPSINNYNHILKLSSGIGANITPPKKLTDHWKIFKKISSSSVINSNWRVCLLYLSEQWIDSLSHDTAWKELKSYISESDRNQMQYDSKTIFYDIFYSYVQKNKNLKITNPYITNTAIHLIKIALGEMPGYIPAINEMSLPLNDLQTVFLEHYDIDHTPTIMVPHKYKFEYDKSPIYYSLQHPTMPSFSIKRNNRVSANNEIKAINYILPFFLEEMKKENGMLGGTIFNELAKKIEFSYFHNVPNNNQNIESSDILQKMDTRFLHTGCNNGIKKFCHEGKFLRGCVKISSTV